MANIEALILDIGNVIYPERWDLVLEKARNLNKNITLEQFQNAYSKGWEKYRIGAVSSNDYWKNVAVELGLTENAGRELSNAFANIWAKPDENLVEFLNGLNGKYKIYALSNSCVENEAVIVDGIKNGTLRFIRRFYFSHKEGIAKPDKAAFLNVLKTNSLNAGRCVYTDDKERNIIPARETDMHCIIYRNFLQFREEFEKITSSQI